ncbi:MAG: pitrilysin family protein [Oscillospiraceae bacterium]|nr:pitrilysin family protein [Oscillospiraceae bacterium]
MEFTMMKNSRLGEQYLRAEHPSGLKILLYPMPEFSTAYALFGTNYGSVDNCFKTEQDGDFVHVPDGIAHFLEHKLFESEDGDAFTLFAETGADANAYTSFDRTCYLFSCTDRFAESLKALLTFVQSPYFTPQTVQKEQGIIGQEIRMYDDSPGWKVMFGLLECLYQNSPVRVDIAGTEESIAKIDADLLYRCYRTFYSLSNMVLAIAGRFDPEEAMAVIEAQLKPSAPVTIVRAPYDEPDGACMAEKEHRMDVSLPLFYFGYKLPPEEDPRAFLKQQYELEILHDLLAGSSSDFYEEMVQQGLLNSGFGSEVFSGRGFLVSMFGGESRDPRRVRDCFLAAVDKAAREGFPEEDFLSAKNAMYGRMVRGLNDVENAATALLNAEMSGTGLFESLEISAAVTLEDVMARLSSLRRDRMALSLILPKSEEHE